MKLYYDERIQAEAASNGLVQIAKEYGLTMTELAKAMGISYSLINKIIAGINKLHRSQLFFLCRTLGIHPNSTHKFFTYEDWSDGTMSIQRYILYFNDAAYSSKEDYLYHYLYEAGHIFIDKYYEKHWQEFIAKDNDYEDDNFKPMYG